MKRTQMNSFSNVNNSDMPRTQPLFRSGSKHSFLKTLLWLILAVAIGASVAYFAWYEPTQTHQETQALHQAELAKMKQELTFLRDAYGELLQKQTTSPEALMSKIDTLEKRMLTATTSSTTGTPPRYVNQVIALITLKDISQKIDRGTSFAEDVKILENTPVPNEIGIAQLRTEGDKNFTTLADLKTHFSAFENMAKASQDAAEDKSLITQMGDFLKITKEEDNTDYEITKTVANAKADLTTGDVQAAYQQLRAAFPQANDDAESWFTEAESYMDGQKLRDQIDVWTASLFSSFAPQETE